MTLQARNNGFTKQEAKRTIKAVESALRKKHPRHGNKKNPSAAFVAARELGLPSNTVKARIAPGGPCENLGFSVNWSLDRAEPAKQVISIKRRKIELPETLETKLEKSFQPEIERRNIRLQDENKELRKQIEQLHRDTLAGDAIREILGGIVAKPVSPPNWMIAPDATKTRHSSVPVTIWADWHASEVVSKGATNGVNEFNHEILERRARRLVERTIALCDNRAANPYPGIVVNLLGDFVSGALHPELQKTDQEDVIPTTLRVRDLLVWAIDAMVAHFGQVYLPCVAGNHGRATHKPEFKRYVYKSFDWLIFQMLARHYEGREDVIFDINEANEIRYKVFGRRYLAMHGDMLGVAGGDGIIGSIGPIMRGDAKVGRQSAAMGLDYDILLMGHWHQQLWLPKIIVSNCLKGYDEYAMLKLRATPSIPSQPLWFEHPKWGRHDMIDVLLEDPGYGTQEPWVSFRAAS